MVVVIAALFAVVVAIQVGFGAYTAGLGEDEVNHYATSVMVHDYILAVIGGFPHPPSPLGYVANYHGHYGLIGIGHWGPAYYAVQGLWMLVFGTSRLAAMVLTAIVATAIASIVAAIVARGRHLVSGGLAGLLVIAAGPVVKGITGVMLDLPIALLCLLAALVYARFMRTRSARDAVLFSLLAVLALLIKGNGGALALLPPCAVLIGRRFDLMRRWTFWLPVPVVAICAGPWYVFTYDQVAAGFRFRWGLDYIHVAVPANAGILLWAWGPLALAVALVGFALIVVRPRHASRDEITVAALFAAVILFQSVVPAAIQDRYLAPAIPPLVILAAAASRRLRAVRPERHPGRHPGLHAVVPVILGALVLTAAPAVVAMPPKRPFAVGAAADAVWSHVNRTNPTVLVAGVGVVEVSAVAALLMDDPHRPSLYAIRGSRLLGGGGYNNADYAPRFTTPEAVMAELDAYSIPMVLLEKPAAPQLWSHLDLLDAARARWPERWEKIWSGDDEGDEMALYRIRGNDARVADPRRLFRLLAPRRLEAAP